MKVSIVIPSYNACERLFLNLTSLNYQSWPSKDFEVIVVDNGSMDHTRRMVASFKSNYKLSLIRLEKNRGIAYARNRGIEQAQGDILIFHDSDMIAARDFIKMHVTEHKDKNTVVCGVCWKRMYTFFYNNFSGYLTDNFHKIRDKYKLNKLYQEIYGKKALLNIGRIADGSFINYSFDLNSSIVPSLKEILAEYGGDLEGYLLPWRFFITNNCSVYRENVLKVGLLDENIVLYGFEDYDLGYRLFKKGCKFAVRTDILSVHQEHPINFTGSDFMTNCFYISEKYNNPDCMDILVYCSILYTPTPEKCIDGIVRDIYQLREAEKYRELLEVYMLLLQTCREMSKKTAQRRKNDSDMEAIPAGLPVLDFHRIKVMAEDFINNTECHYFIDNLYLIIKHIYGFDPREGEIR